MDSHLIIKTGILGVVYCPSLLYFILFLCFFAVGFCLLMISTPGTLIIYPYGRNVSEFFDLVSDFSTTSAYSTLSIRRCHEQLVQNVFWAF